MIEFDKYHILSIDGFDDVMHKEYSFSFSGYKITSLDKGILVYYKRKWRLIHLKNLGVGMQVCYLQSYSILNSEFSIPMFQRTLAMFSGFDEEKGEKYNFLPYFSKDIDKIQTSLANDFGIQCQITREKQGTFIRGLQESWYPPESDDELLTFLFSLILLYGKFEIKNDQIISAKAHIPVFGIWNSLVGLFSDFYLPQLHKLGCFLIQKVVQQGDKSTLQLSITDPELLELFVQWYNQYKKSESGLQIAQLQKKHQEIKDQLLDFLKTSPDCSITGQNGVIEQIQNNRVKFIKYS